MKKFFQWFADNGDLILALFSSLILIVLSIIVTAIPFWFFYKVAVGTYHLLDKLIDKL